MVHIDTFHRQVNGNKITDRYLKEKCVVIEKRRRYFRNIDYSGTFHPQYAIEMENLLGEIQDHHCCYCMRHMPHGSDLITLEHLIPQNCDSKEFDQYLNLGYNELSVETLTHTELFSGKPVSTQRPPHPHTVAYHNFLISCNGAFLPGNATHLCCNNARGNKFINPIFFLHTIAEEVTYKPDGEIKASTTSIHKAEITATIAATRLNCAQLKEIRHIWYKFRLIDLQALQDITDNDKEKARLLLTYCDANNKIKTKYVKNYQWKLLLSYSWFHKYYSDKYPV